MSNLWLDLSQTEASSATYEPLKPGKYLVQCEEVTIMDTKRGDGKYLKMKFEVVGAEGTGRILWHNFNLENPNQQAVDIGKDQLRSFLTSSKYKTDRKISSLNVLLELAPEFVGLSCLAMVKVKEAEGEYAAQNVISYFTEYDVKSALKKVNAQATTATPF